MVLKKVRKQIDEQNMISENDRILVGLSGGADSVCLLLILCELRQSMGFTLEAIHVEHGIRGEESRRDAAFAEKLCKEKNVSFQMFSIDVPDYATKNGLGLEEAARIMRYEVFEQMAIQKNAKIALAHHMEDNAETVLFQLVRGSSLAGLCGIRPLRKSAAGVTYLRPLLCLHRQDIEMFLKKQGQEYCTDATNQELEYSRNYLRNVVVPELCKVNTQAVAHIHEAAGSLCEIRDFMDEQIQKQWDEVAVVETDIVLDVVKLKSLHIVLQKEIIYKAIGIMAGGKKDISAIHVQQVLDLLENQSGKETMLPNRIVAKKENSTIRLFILEKNMGKIADEETVVVSAEILEKLLKDNETIAIPFGKKGEVMELSVFENTFSETEIPRKTYTKWLDYDKINNGFCIRTRRSGDYLIYDVFGHRKKLKQYFVDVKFPVTKRNETWILAQEHLVLWVIGGRMSEHLKVTNHTKFIVEVTIKEENKNE